MPGLQQYNPKKMSAQEFAPIEQAFFVEDYGDRGKREEIYKQLDTFFGPLSLPEKQAYQNTHWKFYVYCSWQMMNTMDKERVVMLFAEQVPDALRLDIDVWEKLMWYFTATGLSEASVESQYGKIRNALFGSGIVLGTFKDKSVTVQDVVGEIKQIDRGGNDSMKMAELRSKVKALFFSKDYTIPSAVGTDIDQAVSRFIDLVHFFMGIEPETVQFVVDRFILQGSTVDLDAPAQLPQQVEKAPKPGEKKPTPPATPKKRTPPVPAKKAPQPPKLSTPKSPPPPSKPPQKKGGYAEIKAMIESRFHPDANGEFANVEGVLMLLDGLAEEKKDEKIRDLYYFDEQTGGFKWNDALL